MRLLLSFILSFFFLVAPFKGSAGDILQSNLAKVKSDTEKKSLGQKPASLDAVAVITVSGQNNYYSTRYKLFSLAGFINAGYSVHNVTDPALKKYFPHSYLYCEPIGRKLLFPKHYFW